jgi:hypothetical protein
MKLFSLALLLSISFLSTTNLAKSDVSYRDGERPLKQEDYKDWKLTRLTTSAEKEAIAHQIEKESKEYQQGSATYKLAIQRSTESGSGYEYFGQICNAKNAKSPGAVTQERARTINYFTSNPQATSASSEELRQALDREQTTDVENRWLPANLKETAITQLTAAHRLYMHEMKRRGFTIKAVKKETPAGWLSTTWSPTVTYELTNVAENVANSDVPTLVAFFKEYVQIKDNYRTRDSSTPVFTQEETDGIKTTFNKLTPLKDSKLITTRADKLAIHLLEIENEKQMVALDKARKFHQLGLQLQLLPASEKTKRFILDKGMERINAQGERLNLPLTQALEQITSVDQILLDTHN